MEQNKIGETKTPRQPNG